MWIPIVLTIIAVIAVIFLLLQADSGYIPKSELVSGEYYWVKDLRNGRLHIDDAEEFLVKYFQPTHVVTNTYPFRLSERRCRNLIYIRKGAPK